MPDTGAPWNIPYVAGSDLVVDWPTDSQTLAEAIADGLDVAGLFKQIVQTVKTDTFSASVASGASTAVTGLTASLTCSSASSKVLVRAVVHGMSSSDGTRNLLAVNLTAGGTAIALGDAASSRTRVTATTTSEGYNSNNVNQYNVVTEFLYSPASTSAITYGVNIVNTSTLTKTVYLNRSSTDPDNAGQARPVSTITVMEVLA